MTPALTLYFGLTLSLTAVLVLYVASLRSIVQHASHFPRLAVLPVLTPIHAWRSGARSVAIGLGLAMALYGLLWISSCFA